MKYKDVIAKIIIDGTFWASVYFWVSHNAAWADNYLTFFPWILGSISAFCGWGFVIAISSKTKPKKETEIGTFMKSYGLFSSILETIALVMLGYLWGAAWYLIGGLWFKLTHATYLETAKAWKDCGIASMNKT